MKFFRDAGDAKAQDKLLPMIPNDLPEEGLIAIDSELGKKIGFTSDLFLKHGRIGSELYKKGETMHIQAIEWEPGKKAKGASIPFVKNYRASASRFKSAILSHHSNVR